jgi:hypothetical protein
MTAIKPFLLDLTDEEIAAFGRGAADVLRSGMLLLGEQTREFEAAFAAYVGTTFAMEFKGTFPFAPLTKIPDRSLRSLRCSRCVRSMTGMR